MLNPKTGFLIPPYSGNAGYGLAGQSEPKSLAEELAEETSLVRQSALRDCISYLVDEAISGTDHGIRVAINLRYNLKWVECDEIISKAKTLVGPVLEKARAELARTEHERVKFENLSGLFTALGLQIQTAANLYDLIGLTEQQLHLCADVLAANEGAE
jgi:hypothetical protein